MRVEYGSVEKDGSGDLDSDWLADGWVALLRKWLADAERAGVAEPNAMVVGTVDRLGRPVTRTVLCKSVDEIGISFYTNYDSAKGEELAATPYASATFPWFLLGRQVHVRGPVTKVSPEQTADCLACGVAGTVGRRDATIRRPRAGSGAAELGRIPDCARGRRVLAGPGEPGAQQDSCGLRSRR
jgi:Pyridoxamine 5'-phosphate oxidase